MQQKKGQQKKAKNTTKHIKEQQIPKEMDLQVRHEEGSSQYPVLINRTPSYVSLKSLDMGFLSTLQERQRRGSEFIFKPKNYTSEGPKNDQPQVHSSMSNIHTLTIILRQKDWI